MFFHSRKFLNNFMDVGEVYNDIEHRRFDVDESLDLYSAGFPCQPFSKAGLMAGTNDPEGRGHVIFWIMNYISTRAPRSFILENVSSLVSSFPETFAVLINMLRELRDENDCLLYEVHWNILNTLEHGVPQHRERVYVVGILRTALTNPFAWPQVNGSCQKLAEILDDDVGTEAGIDKLKRTAQINIMEGMLRINANGGNPLTDDFIIDIGGSKPHVGKIGVCPCITKTRASARDFWSTKRLRALKISEMMRLQGADPERFRGWELHLSPREIGAIIGNAMSLNVMERVTRAVLHSLNYKVKPDRWAC